MGTDKVDDDFIWERLEPSTCADMVRNVLEDIRRYKQFALRNYGHARNREMMRVETALHALDTLERKANEAAKPVQA